LVITFVPSSQENFMAKQIPDTADDSGSAGRRAVTGEAARPADTGQDHYGQTGYGQGGYGQGTDGEPDYLRSDDGLKEMLLERLREDPDIDERDVTVIVQGGAITLEGSVDSARTRTAIENIAEQLGTQAVRNELRVQ
jgi:osmotically-inducible protein OsmY